MSSPPDPVFVLRGAKAGITSVTFLQQSCNNSKSKTSKLVAGTQAGHALIWDLKKKSVLSEWTCHPRTSVPWVCSQMEGELWTQGRNDSVILWDLSSSEPIKKDWYPITDYLGFGSSDICFNNGNFLLAVPGPNQEGVTIWDVKTKSKIVSLVPEDVKTRGSMMQVRWIKTSSQPLLLTVYESGHISLWDWQSKAIISEVQIPENPICITYDSDLHKGVCGTASEKIFIFSISNDFKCSVIKQTTIINAGLSACASRPDHKLYVTGGWDHRVRFFSWKKHKPLAVLQYHKETIQCMDFSETEVETLGSGYILAAGSADNSISLWDIF